MQITFITQKVRMVEIPVQERKNLVEVMDENRTLVVYYDFIHWFDLQGLVKLASLCTKTHEIVLGPM